jgi:cell wall-associated NlpC family hydrolase
VRLTSRAIALTAVAAVACGGAATSASAATKQVAVPATGGVTPTTTAAPATPAAPAAATTPGAVAVPAGMRTTAGVRAKRYKGRTVDGRSAYFARVPLKAPAAVQSAIIAANTIVGKPYRLGGGHARIEDSAYDCSGTVSYALIGGGLLKTPLSSYEFDDAWKGGVAGEGQWISVYGNQGHAFAIIAGLRLDTSAAADPGGLKGPQWRPDTRTDEDEYTVVHPDGL